jgi:hypothetical protein
MEQPENMNMKPVREWLIEFGLAKTKEDADYLAFAGLVRLDGQLFCAPYHLITPGSILSTVNSDYSYEIPDCSITAVLEKL